MAKTKEQKADELRRLKSEFSGAKSAVVVDYKGLKVSETEELRRKLHQQQIDFHVVKASLARIALREEGIEMPEDIFDKPIAIAFAHADEVAPAKEINTYTKSHEFLEILGGLLGRRFIDVEGVGRLAALPSREELYARVVGTVAAPMSGLVNVLAGNIRGLVNVLSNYRESK
ncbi:MAG: 50S ribosomal protein L10 [Patescibacteria group bacterium]